MLPVLPVLQMYSLCHYKCVYIINFQSCESKYWNAASKTTWIFHVVTVQTHVTHCSSNYKNFCKMMSSEQWHISYNPQRYSIDATFFVRACAKRPATGPSHTSRYYNCQRLSLCRYWQGMSRNVILTSTFYWKM